jgi:hypothetical protein
MPAPAEPAADSLPAPRWTCFWSRLPTPAKPGAGTRSGCRGHEEAGYWLELLVDSGTVPSRKMVSLPQETNELLAIFTAISKKTRSDRDEDEG